MNRNNPEHWKARIATDVQRAAVAAHQGFTCRDCKVEISNEQSRKYGICEPCRDKHKAAWRDEHTRKPGDKRRGWLIGDECTVTLKGVTYDAKILDMSDTSRHESNYDLMKAYLARTRKIQR